MSLRLLLAVLCAAGLLLTSSLAMACPDGCSHGVHAADGDEAAALTEGVDTEEDTADWDVNEARGESFAIDFTVDEGTWMSLDVSPDGSTIVFDHLGDLFTIPVGGGSATRLSSGLAWDYQPRYSPDGSEILFTSDRAGGNNLWTMKADGSDMKALTDTGEKDTNCGAWSPDGEWIASKRRLTDGSSIGATELWMFHRLGGNGLQITKKDDLPEASEPVFHPDGRFVYFSARPRRFTYGQNPYQGIYQIRKFDRQTGDLSRVTGRFGGAGRPSISPDGKTLTYISRDRLDVVLIAHDLDSGAERIVYRGLNHDLQESFAWAGTYPGMDFMPDGESIVLWAGGKILQVELESGAATEIPFSVDVELVAQPAVRPSADVTSDTMDLKILRWMHSSSKDQSIVFSALGRIYRADSDGSNAEVIVGGESFAYAPRFSPDGKRLTWVSWDDLEKGQVFVGNADGGSARQISSRAGQWVNPQWSADGSELVVIRGSGATLRGGDLGDEMYHELWILDAKGKNDPHFVKTIGARGSASRMPAPFFSADGSRLFFLRSAAENHAELVSIDRNGRDEIVHVKVHYGDEFAVSPDGKWVAYKRLHDAYLAPMPAPGTGTLDLGDDDGGVKVYALTDDMADWLSFEDAGTLTWSQANDFYRTTVDRVVAKALAAEAKAKAEEEAADEGDDEADDEEPATEADTDADDADDAAVAAEAEETEPDPNDPDKVTITVTVPRARPEGTLVLDGGRLITMAGEAHDEVIENGRVVIEGHRITAVGEASSISIPDGAHVIDTTGMTIIPGLVDAHAHMGYNAMDILPQRDWQYYANLAYGVTATMDPSASTHLVFAQSEMVEAGVMKGPRVYSTGFILYGADISGRAPTKSYEDAYRHVKRMKQYGAIAIKSYMQPKRIQRQWYVKACRELEMLDFPEGGGNFEGNMGMILDGHTGIEHTTPIAPLYEDVLQMWSATEVGYTPTFLVAYGGISGEDWFYQNTTPLFEDEKIQRFTPKATIESRSRRPGVMGYEGDWFHQTVAASATELLRRGTFVNLGQHGQRQGLGCHWDMWALSQGGATSLEALQFATINPARYIGLGAEIGSLEAGKLADIAILSGNPLEDIRESNTVEMVVKNGELFDANTMDQAWPVQTTRAPFMWDEE
ncbi:amidohydrolase [bacterium]|nr:MAG: amidohydrolase [bacterium]